LTLPNVQASPQYAIPTDGRFSTLTIAVQIPETPKWAHDVVLNATLAWNQAQKWYQKTIQNGPVYTFSESNSGNVVVTFTMPAAYASFAVGWTEYKFSPTSKTTIVSAHVYLTPTIFSATQETNATARQYAFRLALHELGHVIGLGHVFDGKDIMDPRGPSYLSTRQPLISTLDLFAIHALASTTKVPTFIYLSSNIAYQLIDARSFLPS
jgi:hypothetical protein